MHPTTGDEEELGKGVTPGVAKVNGGILAAVAGGSESERTEEVQTS